MLGLLLSLVTAPPPQISLPPSVPVAVVQEVEIIEEVEPTEEEVILNLITETFGEDAPTFKKIAECESGLRQTNNGEVLISRTNDYGLFQINQFAHSERLKKLELDPTKLEDNVAYAYLLYQENGTADWRMSEHCWNK